MAKITINKARPVTPIQLHFKVGDLVVYKGDRACVYLLVEAGDTGCASCFNYVSIQRSGADFRKGGLFTDVHFELFKGNVTLEND